MPEEKGYGQIAYETYCGTRDWKSVSGQPLPQWDKQSKELCQAWEAGAAAAIQSHAMSGKAMSEDEFIAALFLLTKKMIDSDLSPYRIVGILEMNKLNVGHMALDRP